MRIRMGLILVDVTKWLGTFVFKVDVATSFLL